MKLRRENAEKAEISRPKGEVEIRSSGPDCIEIRPGLKNEFRREIWSLSAFAAEGFMKYPGFCNP